MRSTFKNTHSPPQTVTIKALVDMADPICPTPRSMTEIVGNFCSDQNGGELPWIVDSFHATRVESGRSLSPPFVGHLPVAVPVEPVVPSQRGNTKTNCYPIPATGGFPFSIWSYFLVCQLMTLILLSSMWIHATSQVGRNTKGGTGEGQTEDRPSTQ